jgi:uncharacterized membrane protein YoaK (UPF0700 family)
MTLDSRTAPARAPAASAPSVPLVGLLRALLLSEAVLGLVIAILLSLEAEGSSSEVNLRFAAAGAFVVAIAAALASRGARRRRPWAWTLAALLQLIVAISTGVGMLLVEEQPLILLGFVAAAVVMLVLSTGSVRRALGQG